MLTLIAILLAVVAPCARSHMAMTVIKGGTVNPRGKAAVGDNFRFPNHKTPCHGTSPGAPVLSFTAGEKVKAVTTAGAGHNGGHCAWMISEDQQTWYKFDDEVDCTSQSKAGQNHDFTVPSNAPVKCATGCVLGWFWTPRSSGTCEIYSNCWDVTIAAAPGGMKSVAPAFKTTPAPTCVRVDSNTHLTPMYGKFVGKEGVSGGGSGTATPPTPNPIPAVPGAGGTDTIKAGTGCVEYTVVSEDDLTKIAEVYDISGGADAIYEMNRNVIGNNKNLLQPGQVLKLPGDCTTDMVASAAVVASTLSPAVSTAALLVGILQFAGL